MGWERRWNRRFYYRCYRDPATGQVRREYVGAGPVAEAIAEQDAERRAERTAKRRAEQERRQRFEAAYASLAVLGRESDTITTYVLAEAGWYQHHRGAWRRYGKP